MKDMETSFDLAKDIERRMDFQCEMQKYVDMGISSTINLPAWGSEFNNVDMVPAIVELIAERAPLLRGLTFYPDGSRGGQPLTAVSWGKAIENEGETFNENLDLLTNTCKGGICGI